MDREENEKITTSHDEIRKWVEQYDGIPEIIDDPAAKADPTAIRINFPGREDDLVSKRLTRKISWDEFFKQFDRLDYAFSYQKHVPPDEHPSEAFHFIPRENL